MKLSQVARILALEHREELYQDSFRNTMKTFLSYIPVKWNKVEMSQSL